MSALNQFQIPEKSILDINGRQTYLGNGFTLPSTPKLITTLTETPLYLIKCPSSVNNSIFMFNKKMSSDNNNIYVKYYFDPVVTSNGTAASVVNHRFGFPGNPSISQCYSSPTVSSTGTLISTTLATQSQVSIDTIYVIDPGHMLLVTATALTQQNSNVIVGLSWYEI